MEYETYNKPTVMVGQPPIGRIDWRARLKCWTAVLFIGDYKERALPDKHETQAGAWTALWKEYENGMNVLINCKRKDRHACAIHK